MSELTENSQTPPGLSALSAQQAALFAATLRASGVTILPETMAQVLAYGHLLMAGNARMNLTRLTSSQEFWFRHVLDALLLVPYLPKSGRVMDVGSGGGVPLFPLMLMHPPHLATLGARVQGHSSEPQGIQFHAIETTQKKAVFLKETADALGLSLHVHAERAEESGRDAILRESFEVVTARALAAMPVLLELTTPLLKPGGQALYLKGPGVFEEIKQAQHALNELCCRVVETQVITLPVVDTQTVLVRVKKLANTPKIYPRKPGVPAKKPL